MISCKSCAGIIDNYIQTAADTLFSSSVSIPYAQHGVLSFCEECGRSWTLSMHTLEYEGDLIPEGSVLTEHSNKDVELSELENRESLEEPLSLKEALEIFNEGFDKWEKGTLDSEGD